MAAYFGNHDGELEYFDHEVPGRHDIPHIKGDPTLAKTHVSFNLSFARCGRNEVVC